MCMHGYCREVITILNLSENVHGSNRNKTYLEYIKIVTRRFQNNYGKCNLDTML